MAVSCDTCAFNEYDEEYEEYFCSMDMDEDDFARFISGGYKDCPFYQNGDEYLVVRKQL